MHILIIKDKDSVQNMDTNTIYTTFIVPFFIVIYSVVLSGRSVCLPKVSTLHDVEKIGKKICNTASRDLSI